MTNIIGLVGAEVALVSAVFAYTQAWAAKPFVNPGSTP